MYNARNIGVILKLQAQTVKNGKQVKEDTERSKQQVNISEVDLRFVKDRKFSMQL